MKNFILILFAAFSVEAFSQQTTPQVIATGGNTSQQSNAQISYTIGEPVIQTATDGTTILTQGYQQPHYNITLLPQYQNTLPNITIFPNPTSDQLQISFDSEKELKANILLLDAAGKQIQKNNITTLPKSTVSYNMQSFAAGKYFITIELPETSTAKTYEIIKK